ncbi:MAG: DUF4315 family protein [Anaerotignaceae bacterium]
MKNKLNKVIKEIQKTEEKILQFEGRLKALKKEKIDLENLMMIDVLRKHKVNHKELHTMLQIFEEEKGTSVPLTIKHMEDK